MTDLRKLSEAATPGEWGVQDFNSLPGLTKPVAQNISISCTWPDFIGVSDMCGGYMGHEGLEQARADAAFIVALVNEFRSGSLIPRSEYERVLALLAEVREGLNEAARFLAHPLDPDDVTCARDEISATLSRIDDALAAEREARG